jgi:3-oxoacid CoA-transferase subunit A
MKTKVRADAREALAGLRDGMLLMAGGFGLSGNAEHCIEEIARRGVKDLTIISNNCGNQGQGLAVLLKQRQIRKVVCSFIGGNPDLAEQYAAGTVEVELNPQGTLAERIRAGGAGIPAFYTPTGYGTKHAEGKEARQLGGRWCILEEAITGDFAIVKAWKGDRWGNLVYRKTARNFNPMVAAAGKITVAEVEELVEVGKLDADNIHTPGIYVQRIFHGTNYEKPIEQRTTRKR